jgi:1-acyl-sn-glycerol-3-phosphate acyltransferase
LIVIITLIDSCIATLGTLLFPKFYRKLNHYRGWAKRLLWVAGINIRVSGLEHLANDRTYVFVANHSSYFDIPAVFVAIPKLLRIMYKKELERIPFFGWYLKKSDFIAIVREESSTARKSLVEALNLIKEDVSVLLFPEGTRSKDGKLGEFKRGAFLLASKSGKAIVPVAIVGAHRLLPKGKIFFRSGEIYVKIGKPIELNEEQDKMLLSRRIEEIKSWLEKEIQL